MIGLAPPAEDVVDFPSGEAFPASEFGVAEVLLAGDAVFLPGLWLSVFFSSFLDEWLSSFLVRTLFSYGLKANLFSVGVDLLVDSFSGFSLAIVGDDLKFSLLDGFFDFSIGEMSDFVDGESAPIWLHVWARRASGLFFASSWKKRKMLSIWIIQIVFNWLEFTIQNKKNNAQNYSILIYMKKSNTPIKLTVVGNGER